MVRMAHTGLEERTDSLEQGVMEKESAGVSAGLLSAATLKETVGESPVKEGVVLGDKVL